MHRGDIAGAAQHVDALMPRARESGDPQVVVPGLAAAALVASARGDQEAERSAHVLELEALTRSPPAGERMLSHLACMRSLPRLASCI